MTQIAKALRTAFFGAYAFPANDKLRLLLSLCAPYDSTTKPKTLLKLAATLINTAFRFHFDRKIDLEVLNNGISYFTGDLLNWTLVGVIKSLLQEIIQKE